MKKFVTKLVFLAGIGFLATAAGMYASQQGEGGFDLADLLSGKQQPLSIMIVGDAVETEDLRAEIAKLDVKNKLATDAPVSVPDQADEMIFLISSWDELTTAPLPGELGRVFALADRMAGDTVSVSVARETFGRDMRFTFYNTTHYPDWAAKCYAALYMHEVEHGEGSYFTPIDGCAF